MFDPEESLRRINEAVGRADATPAELLAALAELHRLRDLLMAFEPELIGAARDHGVSWAALAEVLGVASRQAAERRYLRLRPAEPAAGPAGGPAAGPAQPSAAPPTGQPASTGDERVRAVRDRRAADRAVGEWARRNSAMLRQLAGNVSSLDDLTAPARRHADLVQQALAEDDTTGLLGPLAGAAPHLESTHPGIAEQINEVTRTTHEVRRATHHRRSQPRQG